MPIFYSSTASLWPILCSARDADWYPFLLALYFGKTKPKSLQDYLKDFVAEIKILEQTGFVGVATGKHYLLKLETFVCDAPARAFVKCIKPHNAYNSCERCFQTGEWYGKVVMPNIAAPLRSDISFKNKRDKNHHDGTHISPIEELNIGLVSSFPIDSMHSVLLGTVRRYIIQLVNGRSEHKLSRSTIDAISEKLAILGAYIPREFS